MNGNPPAAGSDGPVVVIACKVLQSIIQERFADAGREPPMTFLEYGLHRFPQKMAPAIQEQIDAIDEPSLIIVGYGLCGNGIVGVKAREHTLLIPRSDDCIAMFLGSYDAYMEEFNTTPGTYYLTKGWLESGSHPLSEYREYVGTYGQEDADWLLDAQYEDYERLCFVAHSRDDLERYRPEAQEVAEFGRKRWGWRYEERLGSEAFIRRLVNAGMTASADDYLAHLGDDFVVIPPDGEVQQMQFLRGLGEFTGQ